MNKLVRVEIWYDTEHLRAFPHVPYNSITREENFLLFTYGEPGIDRQITVNTNNVFFIEIMDEVED